VSPLQTCRSAQYHGRTLEAQGVAARWNPPLPCAGWPAAHSLPLAAGCVLAAIALTGCITKAKADAQARAAFVAGQQQAMQNMQQFRARGPMVTVAGEVNNSLIPWTAELTLAKAVAAADYRGATDPSEIIIVREGKAIRFDPKKLLEGEDIPLQPNDLIQIKR
jgi:hypothetical protein